MTKDEELEHDNRVGVPSAWNSRLSFGHGHRLNVRREDSGFVWGDAVARARVGVCVPSVDHSESRR